jgi:hypothetical protein
MKLRNFDSTDADVFAGAVNPTVIGEFGDARYTGNSYVAIVDSYGLTLSRFDEEGYSDFVTIEMLPSVAEALLAMIVPCADTFDQLIDDAQPMEYKV